MAVAVNEHAALGGIDNAAYNRNGHTKIHGQQTPFVLAVQGEEQLEIFAIVQGVVNGQSAILAPGRMSGVTAGDAVEIDQCADGTFIANMVDRKSVV